MNALLEGDAEMSLRCHRVRMLRRRQGDLSTGDLLEGDGDLPLSFSYNSC